MLTTQEVLEGSDEEVRRSGDAQIADVLGEREFFLPHHILLAVTQELLIIFSR